jgi:hypothetical protein
MRTEGRKQWRQQRSSLEKAGQRHSGQGLVCAAASVPRITETRGGGASPPAQFPKRSSQRQAPSVEPFDAADDCWRFGTLHIKKEQTAGTPRVTSGSPIGSKAQQLCAEGKEGVQTGHMNKRQGREMVTKHPFVSPWVNSGDRTIGIAGPAQARKSALCHQRTLGRATGQTAQASRTSNCFTPPGCTKRVSASLAAAMRQHLPTRHTTGRTREMPFLTTLRWHDAFSAFGEREAHALWKTPNRIWG